VTLYIDGVFEHHLRLRRRNGAYEVEQENSTLHVMDNQSRIALVRAGNAFADDGAREVPVKYYLGDYLGSNNVVIGGENVNENNFVNREEYTPYGETSFGSFARKRYRFTGKEYDEESGLYYYGARYYTPWLGRWVSCDPAGAADHLNLYLFTKTNPIRYTDQSGRQAKPAEENNKVGTSSVTTVAEPPPIPEQTLTEKERRNLIREYARQLKNQVSKEKTLSAVEALARTADYIARFHEDKPRAEATEAFVDDLFDIFTEFDPGLGAYLSLPDEQNYKKRVLLFQSGSRVFFRKKETHLAFRPRTVTLWDGSTMATMFQQTLH